MPPRAIIPGEPFLTSTPERPPFDKAILHDMPLPRYKVRCHSISYKTMEDIVVKMVNNLQSGKIKAAQFREVLNALWEAIVQDTTPRSELAGSRAEQLNKQPPLRLV